MGLFPGRLRSLWREETVSDVSFTASKVHSRKRPLRVLVVTGVYPTERAPHKGTFVKSQVDSLIAAGVEVEIVHPKPGPVPVRYFKAGLQVFLKTLIERFDIVHGHYGLWCLTARMQWTTPVVASFLGDDLLGTPIPGGGHSRKSRFVIRVSRWLCHHVDGIIVKSEEMKKAIDRRIEVAIIPNGVDFTLFRPLPQAEARAALGWDQDRYYVLFGNDPLIYRKGFPLAQAALSCLRERRVQAELVVANGLPQTQLVQYINACNALILPSISEGSPNIVKETMACNVPVVSADVGDVSCIISHTKGCSVCPRTPQAFAAALEQTLLHTEPTTGRIDIAHLECSVVTKQVIAVYLQASAKKARKGRQSL